MVARQFEFWWLLGTLVRAIDSYILSPYLLKLLIKHQTPEDDGSVRPPGEKQLLSSSDESKS